MVKSRRFALDFNSILWSEELFASNKPKEIAFDPNISVAAPEERDIGAELWAPAARTKDQRLIRNALICNLICCTWESQDQLVHYSRDNNHYAQTRLYHPHWYSRRKVVSAVESLVEAGLVEDFKTAPSQSALFRSRVKATSKLITNIPLQSVDDMKFHVSETIWLKDENKRLMNYKPTSEVRKIRRDTEAQNKFLASLKLEIAHPDLKIDECGLLRLPDNRINLNRRALYRIFNNGRWDSGGRFFGGWWQNIPSKYREAILINGESVIEKDYRTCHPRLLYGILGKRMPYDDPYVIEDVPRTFVKKALNTLINSSDRPTAIKAIARPFAIKEIKGSHQIAEQIAVAVERRNPELRQFFGTGIGLKLQRIDSDMCSTIQRTLRDQGIPTLSVHDSFLVPKQYAGPLGAAMETAIDEALRIILERQGSFIRTSK